jgi:hypothetical protein
MITNIMLTGGYELTDKIGLNFTAGAIIKIPIL